MSDEPRGAAISAILAEQRLRAASGASFRAEDLLESDTRLGDDREAVLDLIYNELVLREERGETPDVGEYQARFPGLGAALSDLFADHAAIDAGPGDAVAGTLVLPDSGVAPGGTIVLPAAHDAAGLLGSTEEEPHPATPPGGRWPALDGYEIQGVLGEGGMGVVYRARDLRRGAPVAIKTIRRIEASAIYRFKREFRALLGVSHANLVCLHELISDGRTPYIVMEYIEGTDFLDFVRHGHRIAGGPRDATAPAAGLPGALDRLRESLRQLVEALMALHRAGLLHRDVKPSNVHVARDGRVVLMDFGLATEGPGHTFDPSMAGGFVGTVAYASPEQAAGRRPTEASDWYSVGVMLFEALTGRLPFPGQFFDVLMAKQGAEPPPPSTLAPGVPDDLDALCVGLLRKEAADRPSGPEIASRLAGSAPVASSSAATSPRGPEPAFVGREAQRAVLSEAMADLAAGRTGLVFVRGGSGVGKSALVQTFLEEVAATRGAVALAGRCYERESVPYKALDSLIDALGRHLMRLPDPEMRELLPRDAATLTRVFPVLRQVGAMAEAPRRAAEVPDPHELRRRACIALRELLARVGDRRPLVLAIDDLQWGDSDSLAVLAEILRPPDPPALLLLISYRGEGAESNQPLRDLLARPWDAVVRRDLDVGPLSTAEAKALALRMLAGSGPSSDRQAEAIARESEGNPLFVVELARSLQSGGEGRAADGRGGRPITLDEVLWSRVRRLPDDALRLLQVVSVSGVPLPSSLAWSCLGLGGDERGTLGVLRAGRLIRVAGPSERGDCVEAYHDRVRETVVAHLTPEELEDCHRRLARTLEGSAWADPEVLGVHHQGAGEASRAAGFFALAAARAADALAFDRAATLYRLALDLGGEDRGLRASLGETLANAGRGAEAAREYLAAAAGAPAAESLEYRRRAAMQYLISGHIDRGQDTLGDVLAAVGMVLPRTPRRALASLLFRRALLRLRGLRFRPRDAGAIAPAELTRIDVCWSAGIGLSNVDWVRGADFHARCLVLALRAGEVSRVARALALEAAHSATGGVATRKRTARLLGRARHLAVGSGQPYALGMATLADGVAAYLESRWGDALASCDRADGLFRDGCTGVAWEIDTAHSYALWALSHLGRWGELGRRYPALVAEARERGDLYASMNLGTYIHSIVRLAADEPGAAREEVRRAMAQGSRGGYYVQHNDQLWAALQVELYVGDGAAAWEMIARTWPRLAGSLLLRVQFIRVAMLGLRARCALAAAGASADPAADARLRAAGRDAARLEREGMPWSRAQARMMRAALSSLRGRQQEAAELLGDAAGRFRAAGMDLVAAVADLRLGAILGGPDGRLLIERSEAWMTSEGIRRPDRVAALFAPGFPGSPG